MIKTNIAHRKTQINPITYSVFFSEKAFEEIDFILDTNFGNNSLPYKKWKLLFKCIVQWIRSIFYWFSLFSYGYVNGSVRLSTNTFRHENEYGVATYRILKDCNGEIFVLIEHIAFKQYDHMILESKTITITKSQLRKMIRESIMKHLNMI